MTGRNPTPANRRSPLLVVVGIGAVLLSGCVGGPAKPTPAVSTSQPASPGSSAAPELAIPEVLAGELARVVAKDESLSSETNAASATGGKYVLRGECQAAADTKLAYTVTVDEVASTSGDLDCGAAAMVSSLGKIRRGATVSIKLELPAEASTVTAYLVVVPAG